MPNLQNQPTYEHFLDFQAASIPAVFYHTMLHSSGIIKINFHITVMLIFKKIKFKTL